MPKDRYTDPRPGSKVHRVLEMMRREQGATFYEMRERLEPERRARYCSAFASMITYLQDMCGYDIRHFPRAGEGRGAPTLDGGSRATGIWRVVGRYKWDGSYESYIDPRDYADVT